MVDRVLGDTNKGGEISQCQRDA